MAAPMDLTVTNFERAFPVDIHDSRTGASRISISSFMRGAADRWRSTGRARHRRDMNSKGAAANRTTRKVYDVSEASRLRTEAPPHCAWGTIRKTWPTPSSLSFAGSGLHHALGSAGRRRHPDAAAEGDEVRHRTCRRTTTATARHRPHMSPSTEEIACPPTRSSFPAPSPGSIHTPSMSPHLPVTAAEIAASALEAAEAGAAIVHLHRPQSGRRSPRPEPRSLLEPFLRTIKQSSNVVVNLTTGGSPYMTVEERVKPAAGVAARDREPQHGFDELRPLPHAEAQHRVSARLGEADARGLARSRLPQLVQGHRLCARNPERHRRPLRVRVLRHQPSLQPSLFLERGPRPGGHSSSRPASDCSAASARTPTTSCT